MIEFTQQKGVAVETPSGKSAGDENFPVASRLIARKLRPHVKAFYAFARAIDDIADNPKLVPADKIARLEGFAAAIKGENDDPAYIRGIAMHNSLNQTGVSPRHCLDLVSAFKQDAEKKRYESWEDLMRYCDRSAAPVGRYLLDLHKEDEAAWPLSDALCNALQVINHLQDCGDDYRELDRVYLPEPMLQAAGAGIRDLGRKEASPGLSKVIDDLAGRCRVLLRAAEQLPYELHDRRLAAESAVIIRLGKALVRRIEGGDPLARRLVLKKRESASLALRALLKYWTGEAGRPHVH